MNKVKVKCYQIINSIKMETKTSIVYRKKFQINFILLVRREIAFDFNHLFIKLWARLLPTNFKFRTIYDS